VLVYATPGDMATWTGQPAPDNAVQLLRSASVMVRGATRTALYAVQPSGLPADDEKRDALRDATCAQAAAWSAAGIDPTAPVAQRGRVATSKSLGSGAVTYADAASVVAAQDALRERLTDEAAAILADAGLTGGQAIVYG
jgi:hypothetical protein